MKPGFYLFICLLFFTASCARFDPAIRKSTAKAFAAEQGFEWTEFHTGQFTIRGAIRLPQANNPLLVVYLEGDGLAYRRRYQPSSDPTPMDFYSLQLASKETANNAVYLARPCQFLPKTELTGCDQQYWTSHRYADEVVQTYGEILDRIKRQHGFQRIILVGYSGGGTVAALLATRRTDVDRLISIAANLDTEVWTEHHAVSALSGSLNPADYSGSLSNIRQTHYSGTKDEIVPPAIIRSYLTKIGLPPVDNLVEASGFDHRCCWIDAWAGVDYGMKLNK